MEFKEIQKINKLFETAKGEISFIFTKLQADIEALGKSAEFNSPKSPVELDKPPF